MPGPFPSVPAVSLLCILSSGSSLTWRMAVVIKKTSGASSLPSSTSALQKPNTADFQGVAGPQLPWVNSELHRFTLKPLYCPIPLPGVLLLPLQEAPLPLLTPPDPALLCPLRGHLPWEAFPGHPWLYAVSKVSFPFVPLMVYFTQCSFIHSTAFTGCLVFVRHYSSC